MALLMIVALSLSQADELPGKTRAVLEWEVDDTPALTLEDIARICTETLERGEALSTETRQRLLLRRATARYRGEARDKQGAIEDILELLKVDSSNVEAQALLLECRSAIRVELKMPASREMLAEARHLCESYPTSVAARCTLARVIQRRVVNLPSELAFEAIDALDEAIRISPDSAHAILLRAGAR